MNDNHHQLAERLRQAARSGVPVLPIAGDMEEKSLDAAYAIQQINFGYALEEKRRPVGFKIGLTSRSVQQQLGVDQPDFGRLFADMAFGDGAEIDSRRLIQPRAEGEIALMLEKDLDREKHTIADILAATAYALPALEVVDSRIADWKISIYDTVADNASAGVFVLGTRPVRLRDFDPLLCGMVVEYRGEPVSTGAGMACLGNPLNAAVWLADTMVRRGQPLRAGDVLLTGALGPLVPVPFGESLQLKINGLGGLTAYFSPR
jgi:2-keto-4-pentenoate hydratase